MERLVTLAELVEFEPVAVTVRGRAVAVVRVGQEVLAFDATCTHRDAPLCDGAVTRQGRVLCPWHLGTFDLRTGRVVAGPPSTALAVHPVVVDDGTVYLSDETVGGL